MPICMPRIFGADEFDSKNRFWGLDKSPLRRVSCYELEYYFEDGGFSEINGVSYPMRKGNILTAKPDDMRRSTLPFRTLYIHFSDTDDKVSRIIGNLPSVITSENYDDDRAAFLRIATLFLSAEPADELAAAGELLCLIARLDRYRRKAAEQSSRTAYGGIISEAQRFIELHFEEDISVDDIAEGCHISTPYLHKIFSSALGVSPHVLLLNRRIAAAKTMLISTDIPLGDIASACGFNSHSYFCDCFKRQLGMSPKIFRKNATYKP